MAYTVKAPVVVVRDEVGSYHHVYQGAPVPKFVNDEDIKRLADEGLIGKGETAADPAKVPGKSASKADWVAYATDEARGDQRMTAEDAEAATRDQLAEKFGQ